MQKIMWDTNSNVYRGQAGDGLIITIDETAMMTAVKRAGNSVWESDWWPETLTRVLEHWGIYAKCWTDEATLLPCVYFSLDVPRAAPPASTVEHASGPLSARLLSGSLAQNKESR